MDLWLDFFQTIAIVLICVWVHHHTKVHKYERLIREEERKRQGMPMRPSPEGPLVDNGNMAKR